MQPRFIPSLILGALMVSLSACSSGPGSRIDYKEAKSLPSLETPPDLSAPVEQDRARLPGVTSASGETVLGGEKVLPMAEGIRIERDRSSRWLVVEMPAEQLWPRLREFWPTLGLELNRDEMVLGIMETEWAENRADVPSGFLTNLVRSVFKDAYAAGTRDRYRLRLEPRDGGQTEIYLTHYGLQEVIAAQQEERVETAWVVRPSDPELVHELLNRLVLHLGGERAFAERIQDPEAVSEPAARTRLSGDTLLLEDGFARAWRRTGIALDEAGLIVEDRNLSEGIYYVTNADLLAESEQKRGWLRSLFSRSEEPDEPKGWQVRLSGDEQLTRITVRGSEGQVLPEAEAREILEKLAELLR